MSTHPPHQQVLNCSLNGDKICLDTCLQTTSKKPEDERNYDGSSTPGYSLNEVVGDLFSCPSTSSLAHCISKDCKLGKGIAKLFREQFGRVDEIERCGAGIGEVAVLQHGSRFIYNLVTKEKYYGKPTYETLRQSLEKMKEHAVKNSVSHICMPKIGCGLDSLQWPAVRTLIKNVFQTEAIRITVYIVEDKGLKSSHNVSADKRQSQEPTSSKGKNRTMKDYFFKQSQDKSPKKVNHENRDKRKVDEKPDDVQGKDKLIGQSVSDEKKAKVHVGFGYKTRNPLPDVFAGLKICLSKRNPKLTLLTRNIVAMGGEVVTESEQASHIVYSAGTHM